MEQLLLGKLKITLSTSDDVDEETKKEFEFVWDIYERGEILFTGIFPSTNSGISQKKVLNSSASLSSETIFWPFLTKNYNYFYYFFLRVVVLLYSQSALD